MALLLNAKELERQGHLSEQTTKMINSYWHEPLYNVYSPDTMPERADILAEEKPDKPAIITYNAKGEREQLTRKELVDRCAKFCVALTEMGIQKTEYIAQCQNNCANWLVYNLGIIKSGALPVQMVPGETDIKAALTECQAVLLDTKEDWDDFLSIATIGAGGKVTCSKFPKLRYAIAASAKNRPTNALLAQEMMDSTTVPGDYKFNYLDIDDNAYIIRTTGLTDAPRMVEHSHYDTINCISSTGEDSEYKDDDVRFFSGNMAKCINYPFSYFQDGMTCVLADDELMDDKSKFGQIVDIWKKEGCSVINLAPGRISELKDFGFKVHMLIVNAHGLTTDLIKHSFVFAEKLLAHFANIENLRIAQRVFTPENADKFNQGMIGKICKNAEVKVVNERKELLELGMEGRIVVRDQWFGKGHDPSYGWCETKWFAVMFANGDLLVKN